MRIFIILFSLVYRYLKNREMPNHVKEAIVAIKMRIPATSLQLHCKKNISKGKNMKKKDCF